MTLITTPRLFLRPWEPDDAPRLFEIRSLPEVAKWLGDPTVWTDIARADEAIVKSTAVADEEGPLGTWAIVPSATNIPAGAVNLTRLPNDTEVHIGWYLHPDSAGNGYAAEAAQAVLQHGFAHSLSRVWAIMWPHNAPSARVAAAIGMTSLGVIDDPWYGTSEDSTSLMYRIDSTF